MERKLKIFRVIHKITVVIAFAAIALPMIFWKRIPDTIPIHYNGVGAVDNWEDKSSLILLFFAILLLLGVMCIIEHFVRVSGQSKNASASERKNLETLYPMLVLMNLFLQLMFSYMVWCSVTCRALGVLFLPISLIATFAPIVWYLVKYRKAGGSSKEEKNVYREREKCGMEEGITYRTRIDIWLAVLLGGSVVWTLGITVKNIFSGKPDWILIGTSVLVMVIVAPLVFIKYTLYSDYLLVSCSIFGKERIPYKSITKIQKTFNPLSSAALSLRRVQIDYTVNGAHKMVLISPVKREEFIEEIEKRR